MRRIATALAVASSAVTLTAVAAIPAHHSAVPTTEAAANSAPVSAIAAPALPAGRSDEWYIRASRSLKRQPLSVTRTPSHLVPRHVSKPVHLAARSHSTRVHTVHTHVFASSSSSEAWANEPFSIRVANCESGGGPSDHHTYYDGDAHLRDPNGHDGKWQFAPTTWYSVGGTGNPADASEAEQDYRAWVLWKRDGWGQWECAGMV